MSSRKIGSGTGLMVTVAALLAISGSTHAQVQTGESTGRASQEISVQRAELVRVDGNDLVVKLADGTLRHFPNVPARARATIDGRQVGVHDFETGYDLRTHYHDDHNSANNHDRPKSYGNGVVRESAKFGDSDVRGWKKSVVQDSRGAEARWLMRSV